MPRKSTYRSIVLSLIALGGLLACGGTGGEVRFGMAGPFTEGFGAANRRGAELAVSEINASGGIDGDSLVIDYLDDKGDGAAAAEIAQGFVDDSRILAVVGHVTSGAMLAAAKVYDGRLSAVATTASSAKLTDISKWTFRVISSDSVNAVDLARFAQRLGRSRVVILYENDAYGRGLATNFGRDFQGEILGSHPISDGSEAEIYISWIAQHRPDLVFVAGTESSGIAILREARRQQLAVDFLGSDGWTGIVTDLAASEGALVGAPFTPFDPRPAARQFVTAYIERFKTEPDGNSALAYDTVKLLARAVSEVGHDRERIRDWLAGLAASGPFPGVTGDIAFHGNGDPIDKAFTMTRVVGGRLTLAERSKP